MHLSQLKKKLDINIYPTETLIKNFIDNDNPYIKKQAIYEIDGGKNIYLCKKNIPTKYSFVFYPLLRKIFYYEYTGEVSLHTCYFYPTLTVMDYSDKLFNAASDSEQCTVTVGDCTFFFKDVYFYNMFIVLFQYCDYLYQQPGFSLSKTELPDHAVKFTVNETLLKNYDALYSDTGELLHIRSLLRVYDDHTIPFETIY